MISHISVSKGMESVFGLYSKEVVVVFFPFLSVC